MREKGYKTYILLDTFLLYENVSILFTYFMFTSILSLGSCLPTWGAFITLELVCECLVSNSLECGPDVKGSELMRPLLPAPHLCCRLQAQG